MRRFNDHAVTPIIGFVIAVVLFTVSFYYVVQTSVSREGDTTVAAGSDYSDKAQALAQIIMSSGAGWYTGATCVGSVTNAAGFSPEAVGAVDGAGKPTGRFGLGDEGCTYLPTDPRGKNNLSFPKFSNLYSAKFFADPADSKVDYAEAHRSLGLDGKNVDFHIRSWPVLLSAQQILASSHKDPYITPMYVGNYVASGGGGGGGARNVPFSLGLAKLSDRIVAYVNITNDGTTPTAFDVTYTFSTMGSGRGNTMDATLHTPVMPAGTNAGTQLTVLKTKDWAWKKASDANIAVAISDAKGQVGSGTISLAGIDMANYPSNRLNLFVEADDTPYDVSAGAVTRTVRFYAFDGKGAPATATDWTYKLLKPDSTLLPPAYAVPDGTTGQKAMSLSLVGAYTAQLWNDAGTVLWNTDTVNTYGGAIPDYQPYVPGAYQPSQATKEESRFIDALVERFDRNVMDAGYNDPSIPYAANGDVYPADKHLIAGVIDAALKPGGVPSLSKYTTLIVGSDVDQTVLNTGNVKWTIRDWVNIGGTLISFGSGGSKNNWLQPVYGANLDAANTGLTTPDENSPVLNVPNKLDYPGFLSTSEWSTPDTWTHVVKTSQGDLLAIAPGGGDIGDGKVILTGWRPSSLTADQATKCPDPLPANTQCQALFLIDNLLTVSYRELYLDYGPAIPLDAANGVQTRLASVYHPEVKQLITVQVQVYAFAGGS